MHNQLQSDRQSLFAASPQPMWVLDAQTFRYLKVNSAATRQHGYSSDEFLALSLQQICSPCDFPTWTLRPERQTSAEQKARPKVESRLRSKNGRWADVEIFAAPIVHEKEKAYLCVVIDITEEKRSADALHLLSQTGAVLNESFDPDTILKTTAVLSLESLADICIIDGYDEQSKSEPVFTRLVSMHRILEMDKQAAELKNHPPVARPGDIVYDAIVARKTRFMADITAAFDLGQARNLAYLEHLKKLQCHSTIVIPFDCHDRVFGAITLIRTGARDAFRENDLSLAEEFTRRAVLAIENARLYNQAQKANEAKTQFLTHMSHEMRTPLTAIVGFTEILLKRESDEIEQQHYLEVIRRNAQQLSELIGNLLDLAKIESGKLELNIVEMSPVELIEEVVGLLALRANQNGIQIEIDIARNMPPLIRSDFLRLKQILINILSNAIKFSQKSIVNIRETVIDRSDKKLLAIEVEDHGIGITPENQSKLFQPFIQADSTMARRFGGSGIGLSLSRKIAQALGGDIEIISSDIGKGSTFLITCPLQEVTSQAATATANDGFFTLQQAAAKNRTPIVVTKKITANREHRILVAEDSPDNQLMIKTLLKGESFVIDFANDGAEAIRMGTSNNYDLILMDIQMPIMDGYAATRHLRKMGVNTPILALTAHASTDDRNRCLAAGCNNYLTKPISIDHLQNVIRSYT